MDHNPGKIKVEAREGVDPLDANEEYLVTEAVNAFVQSLAKAGIIVSNLEMAFHKEGEEDECTSFGQPTS